MTRDADGYLTTLRALMMPADTNHQGTVFGGVILSRIDQAGYLEARKNGRHRWVTASIDQVNFVAPVYDGDTVSFKTRTIKTGRSSRQTGPTPISQLISRITWINISGALKT